MLNRLLKTGFCPHGLPAPAVLFSLTFALIGVCESANGQSPAQPDHVWNLWPGTPPGDVKKLPAEADTTGPSGRLIAGRPVIRLGNVSTPQLAVFKPDPGMDTGAAVVIAPGGGHWILAYDLEGTEVAKWFNSIGVTAVVLKYRVPGNARNESKKWLAAAQDGQRAMSVVRGRADELGIDPERIGILGFSAGSTPVYYTSFVKKRLYQPVDEFDRLSFKPAFAAPIYAGSLPTPEGLDTNCPPVFMAIAHDDEDRSIGMAEMYIALKKSGASAELHIYESGGHGYGLRKTDLPVTQWPDRLKDWLDRLGVLKDSSLNRQ